MLMAPADDAADRAVMAERFYAELGWERQWHAMAARSLRAADLCHNLWPGWSFERKIKESFGRRYMFFPMSSVGLDELGERDLRCRIIAPVGVLDPLVWLLYMNGYGNLA
jgi:hypothetical protein